MIKGDIQVVAERRLADRILVVPVRVNCFLEYDDCSSEFSFASVCVVLIASREGCFGFSGGFSLLEDDV